MSHNHRHIRRIKKRFMQEQQSEVQTISPNGAGMAPAKTAPAKSLPKSKARVKPQRRIPPKATQPPVPMTMTQAMEAPQPAQKPERDISTATIKAKLEMFRQGILEMKAQMENFKAQQEDLQGRITRTEGAMLGLQQLLQEEQ